MGKYNRHIIFLSIFLAVSPGKIYGQGGENPPPPIMAQDGEDSLGPCDPGYEEEPGGPLPPPPGNCMPIDDYVAPFILFGIIYGAYRLRKLEQA